MHNSDDLNKPEYLDINDVTHNPDYWRQDHGGVVTTHNGVADILLKNDDLYRKMKGDWNRTDWNASHNIRTTTGRENGKFFIRREQMNVQAVAQRCQEYRKAAEQGYPDPLAPIGDDGKLTYKWMDLPNVIAVEISDRYFGGMPWQVIKNDRTLKAQYYRVVEREYNQFVCYPHGRLPIPVDVPYPNPVGSEKFFKGHDLK
jgi:hypothetical protein